MNCKGRRYLLNFCVGLLGGDGQGEWATFCTIVWWSNGGLKGKPPVDGQHVCLADAERSSSQPKTNKYWGFVWLFLALNTNCNRLYSWKLEKNLLRPFCTHFAHPQSRILSPFPFWLSAPFPNESFEMSLKSTFLAFKTIVQVVQIGARVFLQHLRPYHIYAF